VPHFAVSLVLIRGHSDGGPVGLQFQEDLFVFKKMDKVGGLGEIDGIAGVPVGFSPVDSHAVEDDEEQGAVHAAVDFRFEQLEIHEYAPFPGRG